MKRAKNKLKQQSAKSHKRNTASEPHKKPFIEHVRELRKRIFYVAVAVIAGATGAYFVQERLLALLIRPAGDQQFIYTSPGGGLTFLFNLCLFAGIVFGIPVIVWQLLRYLQPLMKQGAMRFIAWGSITSGVLAIIGIVFGYVFGLPASMHFLLNQFGEGERVAALITIQSYMSFVLMYLAGSALLFQVPLVMVLINRIKPLKPGGLMRFQRWFIVLAFIMGAVISPSPDIGNQAMLSVPMIAMYQLGIIIIWLANRNIRRAEKVAALRQKDEAARAARRNQFTQAQEAWLGTVRSATGTAPPRTAPAARTWREATTIPIQTTPLPMASRSETHTDLPRRSFQIPIQTDF
jgi:sec-independent protein translocase protein TatC